MSKKSKKRAARAKSYAQRYIDNCFGRLCYGHHFDSEQRKQIMIGLKMGLNYYKVQVYAQEKFSWMQMEVLRRGLVEGQSLEQVSSYARVSLSAEKMNQVRLGLHHGLSFEEVSSFSFSEFSAGDMEKKRLEIERSHSKSVPAEQQKVNAFSPPKAPEHKRGENEHDKYTSAQLTQIESGMRNKKVARGEQLFSDPALSVKQIIQIQVGLENGLPFEQVEYYAKRKFNDLQMAQIRRGFEAGLSETEIGLYAKTDLNNLQMIEIRKGLESGLSFEDVKEYAVRNLSAEGMRSVRCKLEKIARQAEDKQILTQAMPQDRLPIPDEHPHTDCETERNANPARSTLTVKAYFSEKFIDSVKRQNESVLNAWLQSKQIFVFEDSFAAQILSHAAAAEEVQGEVLARCPYTSCYIICKEEDGTKLEFFASLADNVLLFLQMRNEEVCWSCELKIDQRRTGKKMLEEIENPLQRSTAMKMLQMYSCLCSAALEEGNNTVAKPEPLPPSAIAPKRDQFAKKEIPDWDVNVYTVTMRRDIKKQRRRSKANDSADSAPRKPHPRRAHWHHYWVGSKNDAESRRLILKWLPEIVVNQKEEDLPVRIVLVQNNRTGSANN